MRNRLLVSAAIVSALLAPQLEAASGFDLWNYYVIPAVARTAGVAGTFWRSDLSIVNPYGWRSITVNMRFIEADKDNSDAEVFSYTIGPNGSLLLEDVVGNVFGRETTGAVEVFTDDYAYFLASARVYTGADSTYGQTEIGQDYWGYAREAAYISGVRQTDRFRTNVGVVNLSDRALSLEATVYDSAGNVKGTRIFDLLPNSQTQVPLRRFCSDFESGHVVWKCLSSGDEIYWMSYASVVDNNSNDAVFIHDRINTAYVEFQASYDSTGWWEGATEGPLGAFTTTAKVIQDGARFELWITDLSVGENGVLIAKAVGYEHQGDATFTSGEVWLPNCLEDQVTSGSATVSASDITGTVTLQGDCFEGSQSFSLTQAKKKSSAVQGPDPRSPRERAHAVAAQNH